MITQNKPPRPNIVLLVLDSVRASQLSCYGYSRPTTPNIDRLAAEGVRFEQAISVGCWTLPVHASLFTGLYPSNHGMVVSKDALSPEYPTLAKRLSESGYQTACFSNNAYISEVTGLGSGFETVEDLWRTSNPRGTRRTRMSALIKRLEQLGWPAAPAIYLARRLQHAWSVLKRRRNRRDYGAALTNDRIEQWLDRSWRADSPMFLFVNYMECHEPYRPPQPFDRRFMPRRFSNWRIASIGNYKDPARAKSARRREDEAEVIRAQYDGALAYLDEKVGQLCELLRRRGILDNTLVIVTSDHGDCLGEHDHFGHRTALHEELVHVPLVIRHPENFPRGQCRKQQVSLVDLYPTILHAAELDTSDLLGCRSLLETPEDASKAFTVAENTAPLAMQSVVSRMVRADRYKYIWHSNSNHELYDLAEDAGETNNLVEVRPEVADQMQHTLEQWQASLADRTIEASRAKYDDAVVERLRALGYVD